MKHLMAVEIPKDVAERLLEHIKLAVRVPVKFDRRDGEECIDALEQALEEDDA